MQTLDSLCIKQIFLQICQTTYDDKRLLFESFSAFLLCSKESLSVLADLRDKDGWPWALLHASLFHLHAANDCQDLISSCHDEIELPHGRLPSPLELVPVSATASISTCRAQLHFRLMMLRRTELIVHHTASIDEAWIALCSLFPEHLFMLADTLRLLTNRFPTKLSFARQERDESCNCWHIYYYCRESMLPLLPLVDRLKRRIDPLLLDDGPQEPGATESPLPELEIGAAIIGLCCTFPLSSESLSRHSVSLDKSLNAFRSSLDSIANLISEKLVHIDEFTERLAIIEQSFTEQFRGVEAEDYYSLENCSVIDVMESGSGIPVALSVIFIAICRRLGVTVHPIGAPGHFICRYADETSGDAPFIDLFHGAKRLTEHEVTSVIRENWSGSPDFDQAEFLLPLRKESVWRRIANNFGQYTRQSVDFARRFVCNRILGAEEHPIQDGDCLLRLGLFSQAHTLMERFVPAAAVEVRRLERHDFGLFPLSDDEISAWKSLSLPVGATLHHKKWDYNGIIVGRWPSCRLSVAWQQQMNVSEELAAKPFYDVLVCSNSRMGEQQTHVCEKNIELRPDLSIHRSDLGLYFTGPNSQHGGRYRLNRRLQLIYGADGDDQFDLDFPSLFFSDFQYEIYAQEIKDYFS